MQYHHILVATDGTIARVHGRDRRARYWTHLLRGRSVALVAPATAARHQLAQGRRDVAEARRLIAEHEQEYRAERAAVRRTAAADWDRMHGGTASVAAAVRRLGGVRVTGATWGKEHREEIPLTARRRGGRALDDLVDEVRDVYHYPVHSDDQLYQALADRHDPRFWRGAAVEAAVQDWDRVQPYTDLIDLLREAARETPRLRRATRG